MQHHTINIEDLSRGSIVEYNGKWEVVRDIVGESVTFFGHQNHKEIPLSKCNGIEVTCGVLKLAGFEFRYDSYRKPYGVYEVYLKSGTEPIRAYLDTSYDGDNGCESPIPYVHLWQRYHLSVENEPLEIRMPLPGEVIPDVEIIPPVVKNEPIQELVIASDMSYLIVKLVKKISQLFGFKDGSEWLSFSHPKCIKIYLDGGSGWRHILLEGETVSNPMYSLTEDTYDAIERLLINKYFWISLPSRFLPIPELSIPLPEFLQE